MVRLLALAMLFGAMLPLPLALAQSSGWDVRPCRNLAGVHYLACSTEPSIPLDPQPCYVSHIANYSPSPPERAMVEVCQAAKAALADPPRRTFHELAQVNVAVADLAAAVQEDTGEASALYGFKDEYRSIGADMLRLGTRIEADGARGNADGFDPVSQTLEDIINASSVLAGL